MEHLTQKLKALATDGNKHRAKVDKRKQRSVFRDVLRAVEVSNKEIDSVAVVTDFVFQNVHIILKS